MADVSVALIEALARIWQRIRDHHPDVPAVVLLPAPAQRGKRNVLGHFAPLRWQTKKGDDHHLHEVVVIAEHLNRGAEDILETLIHEAAHAANFEEGIKDCSPTSQYHNQAYRVRAEALGLDVTKVPHYGWAYTRLRDETKTRYGPEVDELARVIVHRRSPILPRTPPTDPISKDGSHDDDAKPSRHLKAVCGCGFIVRASRATLAATTIRCDICGQRFASS